MGKIPDLFWLVAAVALLPVIGAVALWDAITGPLERGTNYHPLSVRRPYE